MPSVGAVTSNLTVTSQSGTTYTAKANDLVLADAGLNAVTVTLPTAPVTNSVIAVKKSDTGTNTVVVVPGGTSKIDGDSAGVTLTATGAAVTVQYDGTNWRILSTGTIGGGAGSNAGVPTVVEYPVPVSGMWYDRRAFTGSSTVTNTNLWTAGSTYYYPYYLPGGFPINGIGYLCSGAPSGNLRVGLYSASTSSGAPGVLLTDLGILTLVATTNTLQTVTGFSYTHPGGWFYLAISVNSTTTVANQMSYSVGSGFSSVAGWTTSDFATTSRMYYQSGPVYYQTTGTNYVTSGFGAVGSAPATAPTAVFSTAAVPNVPLFFVRAV